LGIKDCIDNVKYTTAEMFWGYFQVIFRWPLANPAKLRKCCWDRCIFYVYMSVCVCQVFVRFWMFSDSEYRWCVCVWSFL